MALDALESRVERPESVARRRVLFICSELIVGGAERQWSLLIPRLRPRFDVAALTLVGEGPLFGVLQKEGVPVTCAWLRRRTDLAGWRRALLHVAVEPDLVVTQSINADVVGDVLARRTGAAHVTTEHAGPGVPTRLHQELLRRIVARRVSAAIAVGEVQVPRLLRLGHDRDRIHVVPNGVPIPATARPRDAVRASLDIGPEAFVAVLVATLRPEKRAELFVAAVKRAHAADSRIRGIVVGGGSELARVRDRGGDDGIVRVLGHRGDVADLLAASDVASLSSDAEGVPMALLEAMALGLPVVATAVGGVLEAVEAGVSGLLVPARDVEAFAAALVELAADPQLARRLGAHGRERHRQLFGVDRMVADYARVFDEVLERRSRRP